jgi:hypothetical protein
MNTDSSDILLNGYFEIKNDAIEICDDPRKSVSYKNHKEDNPGPPTIIMRML